MSKVPVEGIIKYNAGVGMALTAGAGRRVLNIVRRENGQVADIDPRPFRSPYEHHREMARNAGKLLARVAEARSPIRHGETGDKPRRFARGMTGEEFHQLTQPEMETELQQPIGLA